MIWTFIEFSRLQSDYSFPWLVRREGISVGKSTQEVYVSNRDAVFANSGFQRVWKDLIRKEEVAKKKGG